MRKIRGLAGFGCGARKDFEQLRFICDTDEMLQRREIS
jgi:hypothetical protein